MRILIAGVDGYIGWSLAQYLTLHGHFVAGLDNLSRRDWVQEVGSISAIPIASLSERLSSFAETYERELIFREGNLLDYEFVCEFLQDFKPDAIVHLAEMPSAAYSMMDQRHAAFTQQNNVIGSLNLLWAMQEHAPNAHLVKLGTMGEYGTPNVDIPEGFFEVEYRGRKERLPFPRQAGSFYHQSKVHDSHNTMFACNIWGLRASDIMQGVVFGTAFPGQSDDPALKTRLDFDQCFGTVINRYCCQAVIGHPLTVYGIGQQKRGFLPLQDSLQCLRLVIENPAERGEYRVFNQFEECYYVSELAEIVKSVGEEMGMNVSIEHYENPRIEAEEHYYNPDRQNLLDIGYQPTWDIRSEIEKLLAALLPNQKRIQQYEHILVPDIRWDAKRNKSNIIHLTSTN